MAGDQSGQLFQTRISGYDKTQVDERVTALEGALRDARARVEELDARAMKLAGEVSEAHRQLREVERPSYSGLGARIEQLLRLAEEQASDVIAAATKDADESLAQARVEAAQMRAAAQTESAEMTASAQRESTEVRSNATTEAEEIVATATRKAEETLAVAEREAAKLRSMADRETSDKRTAVERELARLRATAEREVTELRAGAKREVDEMRTSAKRDADEMRAAASTLHEETRARVEQLSSDLEVKLAARREEAERLDAERHDQAVAQATQLVAEAEQRAAAAEQRAAKAVEQAESVRRDADEHAKGLLGTARRNAEQILGEARQHADKVMSEAKAEAERTRRAAQRQVDELVRQRDSITGHLDQLRHLLGAMSGPGTGPGSRSPAAAGRRGAAVRAGRHRAGAGPSRSSPRTGRSRSRPSSRRRPTADPSSPRLSGFLFSGGKAGRRQHRPPVRRPPHRASPRFHGQPHGWAGCIRFSAEKPGRRWGRASAAARAGRPAGRVPVASLLGAAEGAELVGGPGHDVRRAGRDLLAAARAQVGLSRRRPRNGPHPPVAVRVLLEAGRRHGRAGSRARPPRPADPAGGPGHGGDGCCGARPQVSGARCTMACAGRPPAERGGDRAEVRREVPSVRHDLRGQPAHGPGGRACALPARARRHGPPAARDRLDRAWWHRDVGGVGSGAERRLLWRGLLQLIVSGASMSAPRGSRRAGPAAPSRAG